MEISVRIFRQMVLDVTHLRKRKRNELCHLWILLRMPKKSGYKQTWQPMLSLDYRTRKSWNKTRSYVLKHPSLLPVISQLCAKKSASKVNEKQHVYTWITFPYLSEAMFRALALEPGTSNANKWYKKFRSKRSYWEKSNTLEGITFFPENFRWNEPFHLFSHWNNRLFLTIDKRSRYLVGLCSIFAMSSAKKSLSDTESEQLIGTAKTKLKSRVP